MTKQILALTAFLVFASCNKTGDECGTATSADGSTSSTTCTPAEPTTPPVVTVPDVPSSPEVPVVEAPVSSVPMAALTFDFNVQMINMTNAQETKIHSAIELIRKVVASETFRTRVLNHTYNGNKTFVDNGGFTNAQIYQKILDGAEELYPTKNNAMDLEVELYTAATSTIGYTYPSTVRIWMNTKYFNTYTPKNVSDNLIHEWLHKLGFDHAVSYSTSRDYSVPYAIGYLVEELAGKL